MMFGAEGAELFKARHLNVTSMNDTALALSIALGPEFEKSIGEIQRLAKTENINPDVFNKAIDNILGEQLANAKNAVDRIDVILRAAASGNEQQKRTAKALTPVMEYLVRQGDLSKDVKEQYLKQIETIKKEQARTDAFTDVLRKFQRAVMKVHLAFMKTLMPVFKDLAKEFKIAMVPQMINAFGKQLQELARDAIPFIKNFISNLSSDEGMTYIGQAFGIMFTGLKFYLQGMVKKLFQGNTLPDWAATFLRDQGLIDDPDRLTSIGASTISQAINMFKQMGNPNMEAVGVDLSAPSVVIDGQAHYISGLLRGADGFYGSSTNPGTSIKGMSTVRNSQIEAAIAAEREKFAEGKGNKELAGDPNQFGGLTLLQREAISAYSTRDILGTRNTNEDLAAVLNDPEKFASMSAHQKHRIKEALKSQYVQDKIKENREKYPKTYLGMNTGTLGTLGTLFANFGKGTRATLHGKEAIVTPAQLQKVIGAGTQISIKDVVNRLNNNINLMISVAKEDVRLERSKLMAMT
jgi:hypothetical protein